MTNQHIQHIQQSKKQEGFTLLELMVTLGIAAILLGLAAASFSEAIKNNRMSTKVNELIGGINYARQIAIARGTTTMICHTNNASSATPTCGGGANSSWATGYLVYSANPRRIVNTRETYNATNAELLKQVSLQGSGTYTVTQTTPVNIIGFSNNGLLFQTTTTPVINDVSICDDRTGDNGRTISISIAGRINTDGKTCT